MQKTTRLKKPQVPEQEDWIVFDKIHNRPKYAGEEMTSETDIPSVSAETEARQEADREIWTEIETIEASSDVVDVVGTYAELEAYDTSKLHDKDLIKVLADETRDDAITYYRYSTSTETFTYVGAEGPYYTASETDVLLSGKQDALVAGTNIQIAADGKTISATDTTYSAFTGATSLTDGTSGLVPAPLAYESEYFLKGDGTWGEPVSIIGDISAHDHVHEYDYYLAQNGTQFGLHLIEDDTTHEQSQVYLYLDDVYPIVSILPAEQAQEKLVAGSNITIAADGKTISATDTTYSNFTGTDGTAVGVAGLVPAPATTDAGKFLKADGTWATVSAGQTYYSGTAINIDQYNNINAVEMTAPGTYQTNGTPGIVPAPVPGDESRVLFGDGTWGDIPSNATTFYLKYVQSTISIYTDVDYTALATYEDIVNAVEKGPVFFADGEINPTGYTGLSRYPAYVFITVDNTSEPAELTAPPTVSWSDFWGMNYFNAVSWPSPYTLNTALTGLTAAAYSYVTTADTASSSHAGIAKLYTTTGQNTNGSVTQKLFTDTVGNIETTLQILNHGAGV